KPGAEGVLSHSTQDADHVRRFPYSAEIVAFKSALRARVGGGQTIHSTCRSSSTGLPTPGVEEFRATGSPSQVAVSLPVVSLPPQGRRRREIVLGDPGQLLQEPGAEGIKIDVLFLVQEVTVPEQVIGDHLQASLPDGEVAAAERGTPGCGIDRIQ